jgi:hypothetical protein
LTPNYPPRVNAGELNQKAPPISGGAHNPKGSNPQNLSPTLTLGYTTHSHEKIPKEKCEESSVAKTELKSEKKTGKETHRKKGLGERKRSTAERETRNEEKKK